jgi:hypothetical protein
MVMSSRKTFALIISVNIYSRFLFCLRHCGSWLGVDLVLSIGFRSAHLSYGVLFL